MHQLTHPKVRTDGERWAIYFNNSECEEKPSYKKLAKIATEQQNAMEKIKKMLDRSYDMLDEEMDRRQTLPEDLRCLKSELLENVVFQNFAYDLARSILGEA